MKKSEIFIDRVKRIFYGLICMNDRGLRLYLPKSFSDSEMDRLRQKIGLKSDVIECIDKFHRALIEDDSDKLIESLLIFFDNKSPFLNRRSQKELTFYICDHTISELFWKLNRIKSGTAEWDAYILTLRFTIEQYLRDSL